MSTIYPLTAQFQRPKYVPKDPLSPLLKCIKLLKINAPRFLDPDTLDRLYTAYDNINFSKKVWGTRELGRHIDKTYKTAQKVDSFATFIDFTDALTTLTATLGFFNAKFLLLNNFLDEPLTLINFAETATEYQCGKIKDQKERWLCVAKRVAAIATLAVCLSVQFQISFGTFNTACGVVKYCLNESIRYNAFCEQWS